MSDAPHLAETLRRYVTGTIDLPTLSDSILESDLTFGHTASTGEGEWIDGTWDVIRRAYLAGELSLEAFESIATDVQDKYPDEIVW